MKYSTCKHPNSHTMYKRYKKIARNTLNNCYTFTNTWHIGMYRQV